MARRPLTLVAVGAAAVCSLAACGSGGGVEVSSATDDPSMSRSQPSPTGGASTAAPDVIRDITVGACLDNPGGDWKAADCATGHDFEVSAIVRSPWDKHDIGARSALREWTCNNVAASYLGGPVLATFFQAVPLPMAVDPHSDERIICLIAQSSPHSKTVKTFGPMRGLLSDPEKLANHRTCLKQRTTEGAPELVRCSSKHSAEAVTTLSLGNPTEPYPGDATLRAKARKKCEPQVREHLGGVERDDLVMGALVVSAAQWKQGDRYVTCFVNAKGAKLTGSVKGIKHRPLEDYR